MNTVLSKLPEPATPRLLTRKEIAASYAVSPRTLYNWIKRNPRLRAELPLRGSITPKQHDLILHELGAP